MDQMKGSNLDAMSDAVDHASCVLYGVCLEYKESANCRLEANYAHQQQIDMVPLMMQRDYAPRYVPVLSLSPPDSPLPLQ